MDADRVQALQDLRDLHAALGELIRLIEAGRPIEGVLGRLAELKNRVAVRESASTRFGRFAAIKTNGS